LAYAKPESKYSIFLRASGGVLSTFVAMIELGKMNTLKINRRVDFGVYVGDGVEELLLPSKYIPEGVAVRDMVEVFVYKDSEDRMVATNLEPMIMLDQFASLEVKEVNNFGAFMEWGLEKDLFVPYKEQAVRMSKGERHIVRLCLDHKTNRLVGVTKILGFLERDTDELEEKQEVEVLVFGESDLGFNVLIDGKYQGLVYKNDVFDLLEIGDKRTGYIKEIREEDGKVDVSLRPFGVDAIDASKDTVWDKIKNAPDGKLAVNDKSTPETIKNMFGLSKKAFKKAIGGLYKEGKIQITPEGIVLNTNA
jgi:predicted RNA-binding protein (virulence factor B family)